MTLVYSREGQAGPVVRALIIGCGRFTDFDPTGGTNRLATVAGARRMTRFLVDHADALAKPLASIECLLSEAGVAPGQDRLPATGDHDPRQGDEIVEAATLRNVEGAFDRWMAAPRAPEDHMIFYIATHGVVEPERVIALLEDVGKTLTSPWRQSLDVSSIARGLPAFGAQASWVFFDACQEVVPDLIEAAAGAQAFVPLNPTVTQMAAGRNRPCFALAGSRFGGKAYAPNAQEPPYFTQALLAGLGYACIEPLQGEGWVVTSKQLQYHLSDVANAVLDYATLETEPLKAPARNMPFLRPVSPRVPVAVRTSVDAHLSLAALLEAVCSDASIPSQTRQGPGGALTWRFDVRPHQSHRYTARATFAGGEPAYQPADFAAMPPAQIVVLRP